MRRLFVSLLAVLLGAASASHAEPGAAPAAGELTQTQIAERVTALLSSDPAEEVRDPLEHARLGLARAAAASRAGDAAAERRAADIARAALALAEARAALVRERALLAAAMRRGKEAARRNAGSKALLETTRARVGEAADAGQGR
jgi:hypothetical protein